MIQEPNRAQHTYVQELHGPPEAVFPLLCPVREREWVPGWNPSRVLTRSGIAELGCVFVTPAGRAEATWIVTRYEPPRTIEFVKHTPGETIGMIGIELRPGPDGSTRATVTYAYTSLGPAGDGVVAAFTAEHYRAFMREWETNLNRFLARAPAGGDAPGS
jgi:hypothetical protein